MEGSTLADASGGAEETSFTPSALVGQTTNALLHSQTSPWDINAGASIAAMSANPSLSEVVVAGRDVLKIFSTNTLAEVHNIRSGRVNMLYSSNDVKWNPNESHKHWIATAATNGHVVIWNLNMKGKKLGTLARSSLLSLLSRYYLFPSIFKSPIPFSTNLTRHVNR